MSPNNLKDLNGSLKPGMRVSVIWHLLTYFMDLSPIIIPPFFYGAFLDNPFPITGELVLPNAELLEHHVQTASSHFYITIVCTSLSKPDIYLTVTDGKKQFSF